MPRPLVLGNGRLHIAIDHGLCIRDLYWPYVGLHNHLSGNHCRIGLWVDGAFQWLSDPAWRKSLGYIENSLTTQVTLEHPDLRVRMRLHDCVPQDKDILLRRIWVENLSEIERTFRLFFAHDFHIAETDIADTVFYNPFVDALIHFKRDTYLLMSGKSRNGGIHQYAAGISGFNGAEGAWRDAEDGDLSMNAVAQGAVDSVFSIQDRIAGGNSAEFEAWICLGHNLEAVEIAQKSLHDAVSKLVQVSTGHWAAWAGRSSHLTVDLPEPIAGAFARSLLTIRTNMDERGAIIAANDSDIMETARAHYSYMWPRDGAIVASALDRCGYHEETRAFFEFCKRTLPSDRAAWLHKYCSDGSWGSTWHPWIIDGQAEIPIQEDSTALVIWALENHCRLSGDFDLLSAMYETVVTPCADFMVANRDEKTSLPLPSYDLWEERRGIHAYTCGTVFGALMAASRLAAEMSDERAAVYETAAKELRQGMIDHLWDDGLRRFARRLVQTSNGCERDMTLDSALFGVFAFGAFAADDPMVESSMRSFISRLWVQTEVGGIARYEGDYYFRRSGDLERIPGNPWFISTLWAARWYVARAKERADLVTALELLQWAAARALESGVLPEQLHPETGEPLSVAPLTWSHAEFVITCLDYAERAKALGVS